MKRELLLFFVVFVAVVSMVQLFFFDAAFGLERMAVIVMSGVISTLLFWLIAFKLMKR